MFLSRNQLLYPDTLSFTDQQYIFETLGINRQGKLFTDNIRANLCSNLIGAFSKTINLNALFNFQMPFSPPYKMHLHRISFPCLLSAARD